MGDSVSDVPTAADAKRLRMEDGAASPTSGGGGSTEEGSRSAAAAPAPTTASPPPNPGASDAGSSVGGDGRGGGSSGAGVAGAGGAVDDADVPRKKDGRVDGKMLKAQRKAKRMRDKLTVNDRPPGFDDAALGIAFEDYQAALRVLGVLYDRPELLEEKCLKALRVAMAPLASARAGKMFSGLSATEWADRKEAARVAHIRKSRLQALDREHISKTRLRSSRLDKLNALLANDPALPLIPDGYVEDGEPLAGLGAGGPGLLADAGAASGTTAGAGGGSGAAPTSADAMEDEGSEGDGDGEGEGEGGGDGPVPELVGALSCYVCKRRFQKLHAFYDRLCPKCADLNFTKRNQVADLRGYTAIVTGGRVKIGFRCVLRLLRCGAEVVVTTRFPKESVTRFTTQPDFESWKHRFHVVGLDLRDSLAIEEFCRMILARFKRVDILINNACQTVRRPPIYYSHLMDVERTPLAALGDAERGVLEMNATFQASCMALPGGGHSALPDAEGAGAGPAAATPASASAASTGAGASSAGGGGASGELAGHVDVASSAAASQLALVRQDVDVDPALFPKGRTDINGQQVDLRTTNSWMLKLGEVSTPELAEVFAINTLAPFILNSKLKPAMASPFLDLDGISKTRPAFIVNVSAMEGKFYRHKAPTHPHTNMAKAALNMMTRTSAGDFAATNIFMTSVDTGWINDEKPLNIASRVAKEDNFQTPLDEEDAAARVLDPVLAPVAAAQRGEAATPPFGIFLKDYMETEW